MAQTWGNILQRKSDGKYKTETGWSTDITQAVLLDDIPYLVVQTLPDDTYIVIQVITKTT